MDPHRHTLPAALRASLGRRADTVALRLFDSIDSTNAEAKRNAAADAAGAAPAAVLYLARTQTGGRGRLGRRFHSPATGLYMTLALTTDRPLTEAVSVTAMAAVAAAATVESVSGKTPGIKWVNDLYLNGGKLAGILTEAVYLPPAADGRARTRLIVGLGMNVITAAFPSDLRAPAASLFSPAEAAEMIDGADGFDRLLGALAGGVVCRLMSLVENDPGALPRGETCLDYYRRHLTLIGRPVVCTRGDEAFEGVVRGVNDRYGLLVDTDGGEQVLSSGEISVRVTE